MESNDSPEIPDRGETSDIPGLPSGAPMACWSNALPIVLHPHCITVNTSAIWQHAAHTTDQLTSSSCYTGAIQTTTTNYFVTKNIEEFSGEISLENQSAVRKKRERKKRKKKTEQQK